MLRSPQGKVQYMLLTRNTRSGDRITGRYPGADAGRVASLTAVFRTERYTLLRVAPRAAGASRAAR